MNRTATGYEQMGLQSDRRVHDYLIRMGKDFLKCGIRVSAYSLGLLRFKARYGLADNEVMVGYAQNWRITDGRRLLPPYTIGFRLYVCPNCGVVWDMFCGDSPHGPAKCNCWDGYLKGSSWQPSRLGIYR
jgi:hypothetical protein